MEQLLGGVEAPKANAPDRKLSLAPEPKLETRFEPRKPNDPPGTSRPFVSPFAADSARKGPPRMEAAPEPQSPRPAPMLVTNPQIVMGSAAPAVVTEPPPEKRQPAPKSAAVNVEDVRNAVLNAVDSSGLTMLSSMLAAGEWKVEGNELTIKVAASAALIDMSVSVEGRKIVIAAASGALGRPAKLQVRPGPMAAPAHGPRTNRWSSA